MSRFKAVRAFSRFEALLCYRGSTLVCYSKAVTWPDGGLRDVPLAPACISPEISPRAAFSRRRPLSDGSRSDYFPRSSRYFIVYCLSILSRRPKRVKKNYRGRGVVGGAGAAKTWTKEFLPGRFRKKLLTNPHPSGMILGQKEAGMAPPSSPPAAGEGVNMGSAAPGGAALVVDVGAAALTF